MAPWKLPVIVAAIAVPIIGAFALGGGGAGVAAGALAAVVLVFVAVRQRPLGPIGAAPAEEGPRRVLLVITCPVEKPDAVHRVVVAAGLDGDTGDAGVLLLSPARIGFLDRWASDVEGARRTAQQNLVVTVAALAKAGIAAEARVGDEDVVQAVEDQLQSFQASEVVLVSGASGTDHSAAVAELESRLRAGFRHVVLDDG
jgi:hypothetical protein